MDEDWLKWHGVLITFVCLAWIIVPYLRLKSHLVSAKNLFLLGYANFVGISAIQASLYWEEFQVSRFVSLTDRAITFYIITSSLFLILLGLGYQRPRLVPWRWVSLKKAPHIESSGFNVFILTGIIGAFIGGLVLVQIPGISQLGYICGQPLAICVASLCFYRWLKAKNNFLWLTLAVATFGMALILSMVGTTGRRPLLSLLLSYAFVFYYSQNYFHYRFRITLTILIAGLLVGQVLGGYSEVRHRIKNVMQVQQAEQARNTIESARMALKRAVEPDIMLRSGIIGSDAASISLAATELFLYDSQWEPSPLHSLSCIISNPLPRQFWPNKPYVFGYTFPRDLGQWRFGYINWGPGVVGHLAHDVYWLALPIYAILLGTFLRWADAQIFSHPPNFYIVAILGSISGHMIAFARGDFAVFSVNIMGGFIGAYIALWISRIVSPQSSVSLETSPQTTPPIAQPVYTQ